jgi:hypothetical protein
MGNSGFEISKTRNYASCAVKVAEPQIVMPKSELRKDRWVSAEMELNGVGVGRMNDRAS